MLQLGGRAFLRVAIVPVERGDAARVKHGNLPVTGAVHLGCIQRGIGISKWMAGLCW